MKRAAAALVIAALLAGNTAPVVRIDAGKLLGEDLGQGAAAFRGIPFAAAPTGPNRWRDAQPVAPWKGQRDARAFGPACPQNREGSRAELPQSEDCLNLNVITPDVAAKGLPVLVSIHGGAYAFGSNRYVTERGLAPLFRKGVVLVTPNYRVGRMGFFAHPALRAEAGRGTGNFWLSDQILALEWVRRNIARFGGDPARVTILGCSAGGSSVNALMAAPAARGLFARAAAHSGGGLFNANRPLASAERQGLEFASRAGVMGDDQASLAQLRALSPAQVLAADPGPPDFGAMVDGWRIAEPLSYTFARGAQAPVPFITGSTSNEASIFGLMGFDAAVLKARFGIDLEAFRPAYTTEGPIADAELLRRVQTDFLFTSAAMGLAGMASRKAPAWTYHFDHVPEAERASTPGAAHCADMLYLFYAHPRADAEELGVAEDLQAYWYNFIAQGNPNGPGLPQWQQTASGKATPMLMRTAPSFPDPFRRDVLAAWYAKWKSENSVAVEP